MSFQYLPLSAHQTAAPRDHSFVEVDSSLPLFAQAVHPLGQFQIPPFSFVSMTNDGNGNPTYIVYRKSGPSSTIVAALSCTYTNNYVTSVYQVI